jgi:hypothetical protein
MENNPAQPFFRRRDTGLETPEVLYQRRRIRRAICVTAGVFVLLCATQLLVNIDWEPPPQRTASPTSAHSPTWEIGFTDGQEAGRADAQQHLVMKRIGASKEAFHRSAPRKGFGANRRDYQEGWKVGYTSALASTNTRQ